MKKKIVLLLLIVVILSAYPLKSFARDTYLTNLDFEIELLSNGDMIVNETWDVSFSDTRSRVGFKTIPLKGIDSIEDVSVEGYIYKPYPYQTQNLSYYGEVGTFSTYIYDNQFCIEWYINEQTSKKSYEIQYRVTNVVKVYNDLAEFYYKLLDDFELDITLVKGQLTIPEGGQLDDFRVWAHGPLNGTIERLNEYRLSFELKKYKAGQMLEIRFISSPNLFSDSENIIDENKYEKIMEEEESYAKAANRSRKLDLLIGWLDIIVGAMLLLTSLIISIYLINKYKKHKPADDIKYYRDLPDKTMTPAQVSHLYYFYKKNSMARGRNVSASILELARLGFIYFEDMIEKNKSVLGIHFNELDESKEDRLTGDLNAIYGLLKKAKGKESAISLKRLEKFTRQNGVFVKERIDKMTNSSKTAFLKKAFIDIDSESKKDKLLLVSVFALIIAFIGIMLINFYLLYIPLSIFISGLIFMLVSSKILRLNEKGQQEFVYWQAFGNFIEDFSLMQEYEIPKIEVWEEYMVYAAMMGKAQKAAKQIKAVYKEMADPNLHRSYLYYFVFYPSGYNTNYNSLANLTRTLNNINSAATRISANSNSSSGGGFGGGFSGGGGGGSGGGGGGFR